MPEKKLQPSSSRLAESVKTKRQRLFGRLLRSRFGSDRGGDGIRRGLRLEGLEPRQLLAGDVELFATVPDANASEDPNPALFDDTGMIAQGEQGQPSPDLVAFAKLLDERGVVLYSADWCSVCTEQKDLFEDGQNFLNVVEVTDGDRQLNNVGEANEIEAWPTWQFDTENRHVGFLTLEEIAAEAGVEIPLSETPTFNPLPAQQVTIGSPIHLPVDAYDPDGQPLTVTVSSDDPDLLEATVLQGNRSLRLDMQGYGDMVFELFEQRAPRPAGRVIELTESGFYDGLTFHRVVDTFVIQGGDPEGNGTGGSELPDFDDQYHPDLRHTQSGILSFAKSNDDTNNSQFFVTERNTQQLDFNHSVFGQLVEGEDVREGISRVAVNNPQQSNPLRDVVIREASIFTDTENSVVMLKATGNGTGQTSVTVTVRDSDGNEFSQIVPVVVGANNIDADPFLEDIAPVVAPQGTPAEFQLEGVDVDGDPIVYIAEALDAPAGTEVQVTEEGLVTVTPPDDYSGTIDIQVEARAPDYEPIVQRGRTLESNRDVQRLRVAFSAGAPTTIDLAAASDTGRSDSDDVTRAGSLTFTVEGTTPGATVELLVGDTLMGIGNATSGSTTITTDNFATLGSGTYSVVARQRLADGNNSATSAPLTLVWDNVPPAETTNALPGQANVGTLYEANLEHEEEGDGVRYAISTGPSGATIDPISGVLQWTPSESQVGTQTIVVELSDAAGNVRTQSFDVEVAEAAIAEVLLGVTDLDGNPIQSVTVGEEFLLTLAGGDARNALERQGVFSVFADVSFDADLVSPVGDTPIASAPNFSEVQGVISTGRIDELGAVDTRLEASFERTTDVATVRMRADQAGQVTFLSDPAEGAGAEFLLYDSLENQIATTDIAFRNVTLEIAASFTVTNDNFDVDEDSSANTLDVLANDEPPAGENLSLESLSTPSNGGSVQIVNNRVAYTPASDFAGVETFTYVARDSSGARQQGTVVVTVAGVNDPPTAVEDAFDVDVDSQDNRLDVLANDTVLPDAGESLQVTQVNASSQGGNVTVSDDGSAVIYTPPAGFEGTDSFTYTVSDGTLTDTATVTVNVAPLNPPPTAVDDEVTIEEDAGVTEIDVLANDSNDDGSETFGLTAVGSSQQGATVALSSDETRVLYTPPTDFFGTDQFTYTITDSNGASATATVTVTVTGTNDPPPAPNTSVSIAKGTNARTVLELEDLGPNVDGPDEVLTVTDVGTPTAGGSATILNDTEISYTPPSGDFVGTDTISYTITDEAGATSTGTLTINVRDFIPRTFILEMDASHLVLPLSARLVGTTEAGDAVESEAQATNDGRLEFPDQAPGNYRIEIPAIPFLAGTEEPQVIEINSNADDGDLVQPLQPIRGLRPEFYRLKDAMNNAPRNAAFVALEPGSSQLFALAAGDLTEFQSPEVTMDADQQQLSVRVNDASGNQRTGTLAINDDPSHVDPRASEGNVRLLRVNLGEDAVAYDDEEEDEEDAENAPAQGEAAAFDDSAMEAQGEARPAANAADLTGGAVPRVILGESPRIEPSASQGERLERIAQQRTAAIDSALADTATPGQQAATAETLLHEIDPGSSAAAVDDALSLLDDADDMFSR